MRPNHELQDLRAKISCEALAKMSFIRPNLGNSSPEESSSSSPAGDQDTHDEYFPDNRPQTVTVIDVTATRNERKIAPLWLYLVASTDLERSTPLPQIPRPYLRIKDVDQPVSLIQKYLAGKLNLANEAEVEILCCGRSVCSSMAIHDLVDMWLPTGSLQPVRAHFGSTVYDLVITLSYRPRVPTS